MDFDNEINQRYSYKTFSLIGVVIVLCFLIYYSYSAYESHKMISSGYEYRKVVIKETTSVEYDWQWTKPKDISVGSVKNPELIGD